MSEKKKLPQDIQQTAIGDGNVQVAGDNNTVNVNQTFIQRIINNIFKSDAETVDQRNRRIMLGHVENFWVKGILEKSLHGAALLELGIKKDPDAVTYPWAIKREATKETLPAGKPMLEIFQEIGLGRSLLILGAPGSGKTTMLLELTRQLIERAREDVTEPIPVVFNLSSWTEKLSLADWLAGELNTIYFVPKKVASSWVKENKMLLLLDGLDEVRQESRDKCVDAINQFRTENGLTSLVVCSRIQDYAELKSRLSFDGAIEIQSLSSNQVDEYFESLGEGFSGIRQVLEKDVGLREIAETPLFLSIMTLAYRDIQKIYIPVLGKLDLQRKHLFDTYIERMFERPERSKNDMFKKKDALHGLAWLAKKMLENNQSLYLVERMQVNWLDKYKLWYSIAYLTSVAITSSINFLMLAGVIFLLLGIRSTSLSLGSLLIALLGLIFGSFSVRREIATVDILFWNLRQIISELKSYLFAGVFVGLFSAFLAHQTLELRVSMNIGVVTSLMVVVGYILLTGVDRKSIDQTSFPNQRIKLSVQNAVLGYFILGSSFGILLWFVGGLINEPPKGGIVGSILGTLTILGPLLLLMYGWDAVIKHYVLRIILSKNGNIPWKLIPFLNHCVDLIFLRRVGGGYIFIHRLLMEHFADMYTADEK
jgi:hypothetical protein